MPERPRVRIAAAPEDAAAGDPSSTARDDNKGRTPMELRMNGRNALVTGGSKGIGRP